MSESKVSKIKQNLAIVIGINEYTYIPKLKNAVSDATELAKVLKDIYGYEVLLLLDRRATKAELDRLVTNLKQDTIQFDDKKIKVEKSDRLLFYFAGHGFAEEAQDSEAGKPTGYFMPQDAEANNKNTWLSMQQLYEALSALDCHHLLMILDCCFAGRFSWIGQGRNAARSRKLYRQSYDRFIKHRTEQIITSAAYDEEAQDLSRFGQRGEKNGNSPFAHLLLKVLQGNSDGGRDKAIEAIVEDKIITVQELFTYLQNELGKVAQGQTPGLAQPRKYDIKTGEYVYLKGEYIFPLPKFNPENLTKLKLNKNTNPYKGLASFETEDSQLFYGRKTLSQQLSKIVNKQPLTIVLGASGSGKSSLVKAGLIPTLKVESEGWQFLNPMRPGESPLKALNKILSQSESDSSIIIRTPQEKIDILSGKISYLITHNSESKLLLVIDQSEELLTLCKSQEERENFLNLLAKLVTKYPQQIRIVLTLRSDFEPQLRDAIAETHWQQAWQEGRFFVTPMDREELQQAIEEPAAQRTLFFESPKLVNQLIDEAIDTPGALPLLSFTLSELYLKYLQGEENRERDDRTITEADYEQLGGVARSLTQTADKTYQELIGKEINSSTIRNVMLRMVSINSGELARRRVPMKELEYPEPIDQQVQIIIDRFVAARLFVKGLDREGQEYVEPVHDALVRGWTKIKYWLDEKQEMVEKVSRWNRIKKWLNASLGKVPLPLASKEDSRKKKSDLSEAEQPLKVNIPLQRELNSAANRWSEKDSDRAVSFLWDADPRLDLLKELLSADDNWFNQIEAEFAQRSVGRKSFKTRRTWSIAIAVMLGLGTGLVFSLIGQRNTLINQARASQQSAQANLRLDQSLDGMVDSLEASKALQHPLVQNSLLQRFSSTKKLQELRDKIEGTLQWAVYRVKETNRMTGDSNIIVRSIVSPSTNSPNHQIIAGAGEDGIIKLWNLEGKPLKTWKEGSKRVRNVAFSPDKQLLASSGEDGKVRIWELSEIQNLPGIQLGEIKANQEIIAHTGYVRYVSFSSDGKKLASVGGEDGKICLWDLQDKKPLLCWSADKEFAKTVDFHPDEQLIVTIGMDKKVKIWDIGKVKQSDEPKPWQTLENFAGWGAFFSPNGKYLAAAGNEGHISVWKSKAKLWNSQKKWKAHEGRIWNVAFSPDSQQIASGGDDGSVGLWDLEGQQLAKFQGHTGPVRSVRFIADRKHLVSSGDDGTTRLWKLPSQLSDDRHLDFSQECEGKNDKSICSPNGKLRALVSQDNKIQVTDINGKVLNTFQDHVGKVLKIDFSSNSKLLVSAGEDKTIRVWDDVDKEGKGKYISIFQVYEEEIQSAGKDSSDEYKITAVTFSPDDKRIISGNSAGYIRFWDLEQDRQTAIWKAHRNAINALAFSSEGDILATVDKEGTVRWPIESFDELIKKGCNQIGNFLQDKTENNVDKSDLTLCDSIPPQAIAQDYYIRVNEQANTKYIDNFDNIIAQSSTNTQRAEAYINRGVAYFWQQKYDLAIQDYIEAIKLDPDNVKAYINRGITYSTRDNPGEQELAIADYDKAIELNDRNADAYISRGIAYLAQREHQKAIRDYNRAIALDPNNADAYYAKGFTLSLQQGSKQKAIEAYQKAAELYQKQGKTDYSQSAHKQIEKLE